MKTATNYISTLMKTMLVILSIMGFVSCQKNKDNTPEEPQGPVVLTKPIGYWTGHYTNTGSVGQHSLAVLVKAGGTARIYDMGAQTDTAMVLSKWSGTWTLNAETLDVQFQNDAHTLYTGTINPTEKTWTGSWFKGGALKGTIKMSK